MFKTLLTAIFFVAALTPAQAEEVSPGHREILRLNLQEAVELGLERNPRIHAMDSGIERSRSMVKSARGRFLPSLSTGYSLRHLSSVRARGPVDQDYLDQTQDSITISLRQTLYAGRTILNSYQQAQLEEQAEMIAKEAEEGNLIRQIQQEFLFFLKAGEDRRSLEQTVERLRVGLEAAEAFVAREMAPFLEVLQARVDLDDATQRLSQAQNEETLRRTRLNALLDLTERDRVSYEGDLADIRLHHYFDLAQCLETAAEERTDLQAIKNQIEIIGKEKDIARGQMLPRVNLELSAVDHNRDYREDGRDAMGRRFDRDQKNRYWTAGVYLEWNFFSGGETYYRREGIGHEIQRLEKLYDDTLSTVRTDVRSSYLRLQEAGERVNITDGNVKTALEGYHMAEERFKRRIGTIQGLLDAQDRLARAEASRNKALLDYQLALADLHFSMGTRNYALN